MQTTLGFLLNEKASTSHFRTETVMGHQAKVQSACPVCLQPRERESSLREAPGSGKKLKIARDHGKLLCSTPTVLVKPLNHLNSCAALSPIYRCGNAAQTVREPAQSHTAELGPVKEPTRLDPEPMPKSHQSLFYFF